MAEHGTEPASVICTGVRPQVYSPDFGSFGRFVDIRQIGWMARVAGSLREIGSQFPSQLHPFQSVGAVRVAANDAPYHRNMCGD